MASRSSYSLRQSDAELEHRDGPASYWLSSHRYCRLSREYLSSGRFFHVRLTAHATISAGSYIVRATGSMMAALPSRLSRRISLVPAHMGTSRSMGFGPNCPSKTPVGVISLSHRTSRIVKACLSLVGQMLRSIQGQGTIMKLQTIVS